MSYGDQTLRLLPEVILAVAGTLIMVLSPVVKRARTLGYLALASLGLALFAAHFTFHHDNFGPAFSGLVVSDAYGIFFRELFIIIAALAILSSFD